MSDFAILEDETVIKFVRRFNCSAEKLWSFLTDPELRKQWLCGGEVGQNIGDQVEYKFDHKRYLNSEATSEQPCAEAISFAGKILAYDKPNLLSYTWPAEEDNFTIVTFRLEELDSGVELILTHENLTNKDFLVGACCGWHTHCALLMDMVKGAERRDFWAFYSVIEKDYQKRLA